MEHDEGYSFGIGLFETMLVADGRCVMLDRHMRRLTHGMDVLGIRPDFDPSAITGRVSDGSLDGRILKVEVSERNVVLSDRAVPYKPEDYVRGFRLRTSPVCRNETSPFTYIKSLQYGDSIIEKRRAVADGFDEALFLNTKGEICEGSTTNVFFTNDDGIVTPKTSCGLLPGIVREYLLEKLDIEEEVIKPVNLPEYTGCFVTNSVLGVMPVRSVDGFVFDDRGKADEVAGLYREAVSNVRQSA